MPVNKNKPIVRRIFNLSRRLLGLLHFQVWKYYVILRLLRYSNLIAKKFVPSRKTFGVNILGYFSGEFGVGEAAWGSFQALRSQQIPVSMNNIVASVHHSNDLLTSHFSKRNPYSVNLIHANADQIPSIVAQKGHRYFHGRYNIGYWFWELTRFPSRWSPSFRIFNEIWVASDFCRESIVHLSPIPVIKITFPVLVDESNVLSKRLQLSLPEHKFLFLFSYDYLSVFERKNPLGALQAFRMAFDKRDDVALVLKSINSEYAPKQAEMLKQATKDLPVCFFDRHMTREDMTGLIASCDSYVSLHRSEGFGLGMAQAMYMKKPVIATGYSGNMEFMNQNNSFPVRYKLVELEENYGPYEKGNIWAEPDIEHAAEMMMLVFENSRLVQLTALRGEADIKARMTPDLAGKEMKDRLLLIF